MRQALGELLRFPSAIVGLAIIGLLLAVSVYAVIALPYGEAIRLWRGGENLWLDSPRNARPAWFNLFRRVDLPSTIIASSRGVPRKEEPLAAGVRRVTIEIPVAYAFAQFPPEMSVFFDAEYAQNAPHVALAWRPPDGTEIPLRELTAERGEIYRLSSDPALLQQLGGRPEVVLLGDPDRPEQPLRGTHRLVVTGTLFEPDSRLDARVVLYGNVHGLAGTDHQRRDLTIALLWGTPIAMAFGLLAAVGTTLTTLFIAAVGAWYGRWVDGVIQRVTEVNLILPVLPILIMIGTLYSRSIWVILSVIIVLGIFGSGIKTYRALFLQVKEAPYIEAARAYGVSNLRAIFSYMVPRAIPVLVPQFVTLIPSFVFLEATLAVLGLGDPVLPTWGKILEDAQREGALFVGQYYWVLQPTVLLMVSGLGFTMLGFALDRVFNPRLREIS